MTVDVRVILMTCPPDQAETILRQALDERLVACGNVVAGVRAHYWWQGAVCRDDEALVILETVADRLDEALRRLAEIHPYEVPKLLAFAPLAAHAPYAAWATAVTRAP